MNKNYILASILFVAFAFLNIAEASAQSFLGRFWQKHKSGIFLMGEYDDTLPFYIGITAEYAHSQYYIVKNENWNSIDVELSDGGTDQFVAINSVKGGEVGIGIPVRVRINKFASISTAINWMPYRGDSYNSSGSGKPLGAHLEYNYQNSTSLPTRLFQREEQPSPSSQSERGNFKTLEIPLHLKLYSDKKFMSTRDDHPYRLYLLGGGRFIRNLGAKEFNNDNENFNKVGEIPLNFKPEYFAFETGLGFDRYFKYFKASLELRYYQSLDRNILDHDRYNEIKSHYQIKSSNPNYTNPYMETIDRLGIRGWRLSIILE